MTKSVLKVIISAFLAVLLSFSVVSLKISDVNAVYADETGTENVSEIKINSADEFIALGAEVNGGDNKLNVTYVLANDIVIENETYFPIGTNANPFQGKFNGNGYSITIEAVFNDDVCGIFGYIGSNAIISGLTVKGSIVFDHEVNNGNTDLVYTGSMVAVNRGTVKECINYATITSQPITQKPRTGGIVGSNEGTIESCINFGKINGNKNVGGIAGYSDKDVSTVSYCVNMGDIDAYETVGGIIGQNRGTVKDSYFNGTISSGNNQPIRRGMVIGYLTGIGTSARVYGITDTDGSIYAIGGSAVDAGVAFNNVSIFDMLSAEGVDMDNENMVKAEYGEGVGYLYAPVCITESDENGKISFKSNELATEFKVSLFASGDGSSVSPFVISSLNYWKLFVTNAEIYSYENRVVEITTSLSIDTCVGIGNEEVPFKGKFIGNNKTITVKINGGDNAGLFECVDGAQIVNFTIDGNVNGKSNTGAVIGKALNNGVTVTNVINNSTVSGNDRTGGIIGSAYGAVTVSSCINNKPVTGTDYVGGIIGYAEGNVQLNGLYSYETITSDKNGGTDIGGIIGKIIINNTEETVFSKIHSEGTVFAYRSSNVGGIFGNFVNEENSSISLNSISVYGNVTGRRNAGGFVGTANGNVAISNFVSATYVKAVTYYAGIVGKSIKNGSALTEINLTNGMFLGMLVRDTSMNEEHHSDVTVCNVETDTFTAEVYYNYDVERGKNGNGAIALTSVELTDGTYFAGSEYETYWKTEEPQFAYGTYPLVNSDRLRTTDRTFVYYFDGESDNYNIISSKQAMKNFVMLNNVYFTRGYGTARYKLGDNVYLTEKTEPVATFSGAFYGGGYRIYGLDISSEADKVGMFGTLQSGAIINGLMIESGNIEGTDGAYVGSICGIAESGTQIINSYSMCDVSGGTYGGGIAGSASGEITVTFFGGIVSGNRSGGIASEAMGTISDCFSFGKVNGTSYAGGICAILRESATIERCYVSNRVAGGDEYIGGIVGYSYVNITDCYVIAEIAFSEAITYTCMGAIVGYTQGEIIRSYYNSELIKISATYGISEDADKVYKKSEDEMLILKSDVVGIENEEITDKALQGYFFVGLNNTEVKYNNDYDSRYAKRLRAFEQLMTSDEIINAYVRESTEVNLFGRDYSKTEDYGSKENPYLIETPNHWLIFGQLSREYTEYSGKYFEVVNDLNMSQATYNNGVMKPIGYYGGDDAQNYAFSGVVYAIGRKKISMISMSTVDENGFGVFAFTGEGFKLLNIDFSGAVYAQGAETAGSIVGYMIGGTINACTSDIRIVGDGDYFGGLVGRANNKTVITESVYYGTIEYQGNNADAGEYGILGMAKGVVSLNTTNTWYVVDETLEYNSNGYGSVLHNSGVTIKVKFDATKGVGFEMENVGEYVANILNSNNESVFAGTEFYPQVSSSNIMEYYARYCSPVIIKVNGIELLANNVSADGNVKVTYNGVGYYYVGQTVRLVVSWLKTGVQFDGLKINGIEFSEYTLAASANDCVVLFTMEQGIEDVDIVTEEIGTETPLIAFVKESGSNYDGTDRLKQGEYTFGMDSNILKMDVYKRTITNNGYVDIKTTEMMHAGTYVINIKIFNNATDEAVVGIYETTYVIAPRILSFTSVPEEFFVKSYDGADTAEYYFNTANGDYVQFVPTNIIDGETYDIVYVCKWNGVNAGTGYDFYVTECKVYSSYEEGIISEDYEFDSSGFPYAYAGYGEIAKAVVTVTISKAQEINGKMIFTHEYNGNAPEIDDVFPTSIEWTFTLSESSPQQATVKNGVGLYKIGGIAKDSNYTLSWNTEYFVEITPYAISVVDYSKTNGLYYNGKGLSERDIQAHFTGITGDINHEAKIEFYADLNGDGILNEEESKAECILSDGDGKNAGIYFAKAISVDLNYVIVAPEEKIIVNRALDGGDIEFKIIKKNRDGSESEIANRATITVGDVMQIKFTDSVSAGTILESPFNLYIRMFNTTTGGKLELMREEVANEEDATYSVEREEGTVYYAVYIDAVSAGANVNFEISISDAKNYEDRVSAPWTVSVNYANLYIKLGKQSFKYGDKIEPEKWASGINPETIDLSQYTEENMPYTENWLEYFTDPSCAEEYKIDVTKIRGYRAPMVSASGTYDAGATYRVIFTGGSSDGYNLIYEYDNGQNLRSDSFVVTKKEIIIIPNESSFKQYGEHDKGNVEYRIVEYVNGENKEITMLPNGLPIVLEGELGREPGENVGQYNLTVGTLVSDESHNKNYDIWYMSLGGTDLSSSLFKFEIVRKPIVLAVKPGQKKQYGEADGRIEVILLEGIENNVLVKDEVLGINDSIEIFYVALNSSRTQGESVGKYDYSISVNSSVASRLNYEILRIEINGEQFEIVPAVPKITVSLNDRAVFGDEVSKLDVNVYAYVGNNEIKGKYTLTTQDGLNGNNGIFGKVYKENDDKTLSTLNVRFVPEDRSYAITTVTHSVKVYKRTIKTTIYKGNINSYSPATGAIFPYSGKSVTEQEFYCKAENTVEGVSGYRFIYEFEGDVKNVTSAGFKVTVTIESEYYQSEPTSVNCTISKALLTVKAVDRTMTYGDTFEPVISYVGFVNGETKSVLKKQAKIENVPTNGGYHSIIPSGAESDNYEFVYEPGILTVNLPYIETDLVRVEGILNPMIVITAQSIEKGSDIFINMEKHIDKALGFGTFKKYSHKLNEYVAINTEGKLSAADYEYTVKFSSIAEGDKILVYSNGNKIEEIEYTMKEVDGEYYVTFYGNGVLGVGVFTEKNASDKFQDFIPYIVVIVIALAIVGGTIGGIVGVKRHNRNKEKEYVMYHPRMK